MKTSKLITAMTLSALVTITAVSQAAAEISPQTEAKQSGVMIGSFVTGGIAGGPLGAVAGFLAGVWMSEQVKEADQAGELERQLVSAEQQIDSLSTRLSDVSDLNRAMAQAALDQLQLSVLFKTGEGKLTDQGYEQLDKLADFLSKNTDMVVRLDGFADPRGGERFNLALSEQRVESVADALKSSGVDDSQINSYFHGAAQSSAAVGDFDAYALERVVKVQMSRKTSNNILAQTVLRK